MANTRENNPYVGPQAFEIKDREKFAGRDRDILDIYRLLIAERIVLLFSPSGAGKSSLLNAGLRPRMMDKKFRVYPVVRVNLPVPEDLAGAGKVNRYVMSMLQTLEGARTTTSNEQLAGLTINDYLTQRLRPASAPEGEEREAVEARSLFIFDQFEEILTVNPNDYEGKQEFFAQLGDALEESGRWALFAVREDYVAALDPYLRFLPTRLSHRYRLDLLDADSAREAICKPAELMGVHYEVEAANHLLKELRSVRVQLPDGTWDPEPQLGRYVEPVQLQVVCHRLWAKIDEDDTITLDEVTRLGSVDESLAGFYEDKVKETAAAVSVLEKDIRTWFDTSLITPNNIRAQVMWEKDRSGGPDNKLDNEAIAYLEKTHLIRAESRRGVKWLELAHDRLVKPVRESNRQWFEDPNNLSTLQRQAMLWAAEGEPPRLLLRDRELSEAEAWAAAGQTLSKTERRFLDECLSQRERLEEEERRKEAEALSAINEQLTATNDTLTSTLTKLRASTRRVKIFTGVIAIIAVYALLASAAAGWQRNVAIDEAGKALAAQAQAQKNATIAENRAEDARVQAEFAQKASARSLSLNLALNGSTLTDQNPPLAALLSLEAMRVADEKDIPFPAAAEQNIRDLLGVKHEYLLGGHANAVTHIIFSPDEQWLVTADKETEGEVLVGENSVRIWNMEAQDPSRVHTVLGRQLAYLLQVNPDWTALEISPDSQWVVLGDRSGGIVLYNLAKQESQMDVFNVPSGKESGSPVEITAMAFGQQGGKDWLAVGSLDGTVVLIEFSEENLAPLSSEGGPRNIITLPGSGIQRINTLAFSKDGRWLAGGSSDHQIRVWDMQRPESTPFSHPAQEGEILGLAYSEEYLLAYGATSTLYIYNAREPSNERNMYTAASSLSEITAVAFDPLDPGRVVVGQADGSTWFLDLASLTSTPVFFASKGAVSHLVLTPDGRWLVSAGADRRVRLWSLNGSYETGVAETSTVLRTFEDQINSLQFSPGGKWLAAGSADHSVALWDVRSGFETVEPVKLAEADKSVYLPSFSVDGQWLAAMEIKIENEEEISELKVWNSQTFANGDRTLHLSVENGYPYAFSPNGNDFAAGIWENEVVSIGLYDLQDPGKEAQQIAQNMEDISFLSFSPGDGRWLAAYNSVRNEVLIWDTTDLSKDPVVRALESSEPYSSFSFSPQGNWLAAVYSQSNLETGDEIYLLNLAEPSITLSYSSGDGGVYDFSFSPDERWFAVGTLPGEADGNAYLWDLSEPNPQPVSLPSQHTGYVNTLAFDTTSQWLATGDDAGVVRIWEVSGSISSSTHAIPSHNDWVVDVSFSPDGEWFVSSAADGSLNLWIVDELLSDPSVGYYALRGHESFVTSLVFSPEHNRLVSSSYDGTIRLWDLSNPFATPIILKDSSQAGAAVIRSPDGRFLLSDPSTGDARLWHLDVADLQTLACEYAGRNMSQEEWGQYLGDRAYSSTCTGLPDPEDPVPAEDGGETDVPTPAAEPPLAPAATPGQACSVSSDVSVNITFENGSEKTIDVYWSDYGCNRALYATLLPGESYVQGTFATHAWVFVDAETGADLKEYVAGTTDEVVTIP
jgi:WD40 repeat protein